MIGAIRLTVSAAMAAALAACVSAPEVPSTVLSETVDPAPAPAALLYAARDLASGEIEEVSLEIDAGGYRGVSSSGCVWTEGERYGPSLSWSGCGGAGGTQTVTAEEGALWPLAVGNTKTWSFTGRNERGDAWNASRTCTVEAAERVTLPEGESLALKVVCEDPYARRTYWHSPQTGAPVYFQRFDKRRNEYETQAIVLAEG